MRIKGNIPMRIKFYTDRPFGVKVRRWLKSQGEKIVDKNPDLIISCYNPKIIPKEELTVPAINFHPGFLPLNRGMFPHIWPLVDGSFAGVTLHWISDKLDAGDIIAQERVAVTPRDTGGSIEEKTQNKIFWLFKKMWPRIKKGKAPRFKQIGKGSYHAAKEGVMVTDIIKKRELEKDTSKNKVNEDMIENFKKMLLTNKV